MARADGVTWYPMDTGITHDDKISDLMYSYGDGDPLTPLAALGLWQIVLDEIYSVGYFVTADERFERRICRENGIDIDTFEDFLERCVSCDLFDASLWTAQRTCTSRGIQRRWLKAKKRSIDTTGLQCWLLDGAPSGDTAASAAHCAANSRNAPQCAANSRNAPQIPVEERRGEKRREEEVQPPNGGLSGKPDRPKHQDAEDAIIDRTIAHLNDAAGTHFSPKAKAARRHIRARLAEGHTEADLIAVIDAKCADWLRDPRMRPYLRPETLFNSEKFDGYLGIALARAPSRTPNDFDALPAEHLTEGGMP